MSNELTIEHSKCKGLKKKLRSALKKHANETKLEFPGYYQRKTEMTS